MSFKGLQGYYGEVYIRPTPDYQPLSNTYNGGVRGDPETFNDSLVNPVTRKPFLVYVNTWNMRLSIDKIQWDNTDKVISIGPKQDIANNPFYMRNYLYGLVDGSVTMSGFWNDEPGNRIFGASKRLRVGMQVDALLFYREDSGYSIGGVIQQVSTSVEVTGISTFTMDVQIENIFAYIGMD